MKICVGIISYMPDTQVREHRKQKLQKLVQDLNKYLNLPIMIIAQNWKDDVIITSATEVVLYKYNNPLGINGARKQLREKFIQSKYDYLIMIDDDILLYGSQDSFDNYIEHINKYPTKFIKIKPLTLQMFGIPKSIYQLVDFPDLEPVNGEYLEDLWLIKYLELIYPENLSNLQSLNIHCDGNPVNDEYSTWYFGQFDKHKMGDTTRSLIRQCKN